jgi:hypothetical protein
VPTTRACRPGPRGLLLAALLLAGTASAQEAWILDVRLEDFVRAAHGRLALSARNLDTGEALAFFGDDRRADPLLEHVGRVLGFVEAAAAARGTDEGPLDPDLLASLLSILRGDSGAPELPDSAQAGVQALASRAGLRLDRASPTGVRSLLEAALSPDAGGARRAAHLRQILLAAPPQPALEELPAHLLGGAMAPQGLAHDRGAAAYIETPAGRLVVVAHARDYAGIEMVDRFLATLVRAAVRRLGGAALRPVEAEAAAGRFALLDASSPAEFPRDLDAPERMAFAPGSVLVLGLAAARASTPVLAVRVRSPGGGSRTERRWIHGEAAVHRLEFPGLLVQPGPHEVTVAYGGRVLGVRRIEVYSAPGR